MVNLSLVMIVKDEEKSLAKCLESVKSLADEIVIVDTGSTDRTKEIANSFGAKVFEFEWNNDFSEARNYALANSTGNWILYLDADEYLSADSIDELGAMIECDRKLGVRCTVHSFSAKNDSPVLMRFTRLFRNLPDIKFTGRVHEQIDESLKLSGYDFAESNITIYHTGYNVSENVLKGKAERNLKILLEKFEDYQNSYIAYQIANSYSILENEEKALKYYKDALSQNNLADEYKTIALTYIAGIELQNFNFPSAKEYIDCALKVGTAEPNSLLTAAQIYSKLELTDKSLAYCKMSLNSNKNIYQNKNYRLVSAVINSRIIIYKGIQLSCQFNSKSNLKYFLDQLEAINRIAEMNLIIRMCARNHLSKEELSQIANYIDDDSIEMYLLLIEKYLSGEDAIAILEKIESEFSENCDYFIHLGNAYSSEAKHSAALEKYEAAIKLPRVNPAVYFYLISSYLRINNFSKIILVLSDAKEKFAANVAVLYLLSELENKVKPVLSSVMQ